MPPRGLLAVLATGLILAGCGGDSGDGDEPQLGAEPAKTERTAPATETATQPAPTKPKPTAAFDKFAAGLGGQAGVTYGPVGGTAPRRLGPVAGGVAWSTIKVVLAARLLEVKGGPDGLGPLAEPMRRAITASDNAAADQMFKALGSSDTAAAASATKVLRKAGDSTTNVSDQGRDGFSPYGQTEWSLTEQHRFMSRLAGGCVLDEPSTQYLMELMGQVVADQRWGLGTVGAGAFKGGWGPGTGGGYLVRQMGVVDIDGKQTAVTLAALPSDGQFASGTAMLSKMAKWVKDNADGGGAGGGC